MNVNKLRYVKIKLHFFDLVYNFIRKILEYSAIMKNISKLNNKTEQRPWGFYTVLAQDSGYLIKIIHVNQGQKLSVQSHNHRSEHWVVLTGVANVLLDNKNFILNCGQSIDIPTKSIHSLSNETNKPLEILEIQRGEILSEDDIIRYKDIYGRC